MCSGLTKNQVAFISVLVTLVAVLLGYYAFQRYSASGASLGSNADSTTVATEQSMPAVAQEQSLQYQAMA